MSAMATYQCPKGHTSTEPDYCSECGAPIGPSTGAGATASATAPSTGPELCPDCQTPRTPGARFCEVCRYDFEKRASSGHGSSSAVEPAATIAPPTVPTGQAGVAPAVTGAGVDAAAAVGTPSATSAQRLNVVVVTDPSLVTDDDLRKQCPQNAPDLVFPLDLDETLVGRRSDIRNIFPEIDLDDVGVSHRQLKLLRQPDGSFAALELGSANGTTLNGVALKPGLVTPVAAGDELLVGLWTRLQLRSR